MIANLVRENVKKMQAYSSARSEFEGDASILLDANENNLGSAAGGNYNRYPDPMQHKLKRKIATLNNTTEHNIFLGNGSDEAIDLLMRVFCNPGVDNILYFNPTFNMYEVAANLNDVEARDVPLDADFQIDTEATLNAIDDKTKIIFFCTPNNPTGNNIEWSRIEPIVKSFKGIIVFDEAYYDFVSNEDRYPEAALQNDNIVILKTFSKSWGMAGLRLGMIFACEELIGYVNKIKHPYNINEATQALALAALEKEATVNQWIQQTIEERNRVEDAIKNVDSVVKVYPSSTNFILVKFEDGNKMYKHLLSKGIVTRNRSNTPGLANCIRITIGTEAENNTLIAAIKSLASATVNA